MFWFGSLLRASNRCGGGISFVVDVRRFLHIAATYLIFFHRLRVCASGFGVGSVAIYMFCEKIGRVREMR